MIFTGNGYSAEWPIEASKRGLPNLNTTPKAVATWNSDKNKKPLGLKKERAEACARVVPTFFFKGKTPPWLIWYLVIWFKRGRFRVDLVVQSTRTRSPWAEGEVDPRLGCFGFWGFRFFSLGFLGARKKEEHIRTHTHTHTHTHTSFGILWGRLKYGRNQGRGQHAELFSCQDLRRKEPLAGFFCFF